MAMPPVSEPEMKALTEAVPLVRFAAEHVKDLPPDLSLAIAEAREAAANGTWTPKVSERFWTAFAKLCQLIQPTTMDCLAAANRNIDPYGFPFNRRKRHQISLAERSSRCYLTGLFILIFLLVVTQLWVWLCTNLSKSITDLSATNKVNFATVSDQFVSLSQAPGPQGK